MLTGGDMSCCPNCKILLQNLYAMLCKSLQFIYGKRCVTVYAFNNIFRMFFFLPFITEIPFYENHVAVALYTFKALYFAFSSHQVSFKVFDVNIILF